MRRWRERLRQDPVRYAKVLKDSRERMRTYRSANQEGYLALQRAWVDRNRELVYARNREYAQRNRSKIAAQQHAAWVADLEANRARRRARQQASYAKDPKAHLDYMKRWRAANRERARAYVRLAGHRRRAAAGGEHIRVEDWENLLRKHSGRCAYCGDKALLIEADHRVPLSRGGRNVIENILPACRHCNRRKQKKTDVEFRAWLAAEAMASTKTRGSGRRAGSAEAEGPY
jgi:5-methylcytosine-specific restriction endonuclease McrA